MDSLAARFARDKQPNLLTSNPAKRWGTIQELRRKFMTHSDDYLKPSISFGGWTGSRSMIADRKQRSKKDGNDQYTCLGMVNMLQSVLLEFLLSWGS